MSTHFGNISIEGFRLRCSCLSDKEVWCSHLDHEISAGGDAKLINADMQLNVPIIPTRDVFAFVRIEKPLVGESALMSLEYAPEIGSPYRVSLGFWNPGEGCLSIRGVIIDYMKSKIHPDEKIGGGLFLTKCPEFSHKIKSSRIMEENCDNSLWKWNCLWNMVMEKACTPCMNEGALSSDNFGLGGVSAPSAPWRS